LIGLVNKNLVVAVSLIINESLQVEGEEWPGWILDLSVQSEIRK
jgi:hypothetical protein